MTRHVTVRAEVVPRFIREQSDIPSEFKRVRLPVIQDGARIGLTKHARLRFWQRIRQNVTDQEIIQEAAYALRSGDPRFRFRAHIFDNPHRPTVIKLITVLRGDMWLRPFFVDCQWERDEKWHRHLELTVTVRALEVVR